MREFRIKVLPGMGSPHGKWQVISLDEFLVKFSPNLRMHIGIAKQFPPLHILNEELLSGGRDLGMGGGCYWKPFEISESEYNELSEEMLTSPLYDLEYDKNLENRKTLSSWCHAVLSHHNPRKRRP